MHIPATSIPCFFYLYSYISTFGANFFFLGISIIIHEMWWVSSNNDILKFFFRKYQIVKREIHILYPKKYLFLSFSTLCFLNLLSRRQKKKKTFFLSLSLSSHTLITLYIYQSNFVIKDHYNSLDFFILHYPISFPLQTLTEKPLLFLLHISNSYLLKISIKTKS